MTRRRLRSAARTILRAGLAAVEPGRLVRARLRVRGRAIRVAGIRLKDPKRIFVVSVGKAAVPMARAAQEVLGERIGSTVLIAPEKAPRMARTTAFVSGHPLPNAAGLRAGRSVIRLLRQAGENDLVLLLLSGGASALMPAPVTGVSLSDKQTLTRLLLARGARIAQINAVRKRLSRLKGGGFARLAAPAQVVTLALSDVPGDDLSTIGSGPSVQDTGARTAALRAVRRFLKKAEVSEGVLRALKQRSARPGSGAPARTIGIVIGSGRTFAQAAGKKAKELGFRLRLRPDALRGEARRCGPALVAEFKRLRRGAPLCLIATGETVVTVRGPGIGGRNQEVALSAVPSLARLPVPSVLATLATDGRDGPSDASGGLIDDLSLRRARAMGVSVQAALARNDSTSALRPLGDLLVTGPTETNVSDVALVLG